MTAVAALPKHSHVPPRPVAHAIALIISLSAASCGLAGPGAVDDVADAAKPLEHCVARPLGSAAGDAGQRGPEDVAIDRAAGMAYVSVSNPFAKDGERRGYLMRLDLRDAALPLLDITPPFLAPDHDRFAPHGMGLIETSSGLRMYLINHPRTGPGYPHEILVLDIARAGRTSPGRPDIAMRPPISGQAMTDPNDVAAIDPDRVFFTNLKGGRGVLADMFGLNKGGVVLAVRGQIPGDPGTLYKQPVPLSYGNGIAVTGSENRRILHVAESQTGAIHSYLLDESGLTGGATAGPPASRGGECEMENRNGHDKRCGVLIPYGAPRFLGSAPDNIDVDPDSGGLLIGSHPSVIRFALNGLRLLGVTTSPSEVIWLENSGQSGARALRLFHSRGAEDDDMSAADISASSVAAIYRPAGGPSRAKVVIGSVFAKKLLICELPDGALPRAPR